jgi:glycosyltransferase involved in cell wall biosynthesis
MKPPRIALIVPCFNEAAAISKVIEGFKAALPDIECYVFDNNSTDNTSEIALQCGAQVKQVKLKGKGNVVRRMFADVDADIYIMVDGDGTYEIIVHLTGRARDNSQAGFTDAPLFHAYKLDGTFLWQIDLGKNIRDGAHYTQFMVYDLDGDGRAELVCKTADGTVDGKGKIHHSEDCATVKSCCIDEECNYIEVDEKTYKNNSERHCSKCK